MRLPLLALAALLVLPMSELPACGEPSAPDARTKEAGRLMDEAHKAIASGDAARGRTLMEQAAATGDPEALNAFALFIERGIGGDPDPERARPMFEKAAAEGSIGAKLNLGVALIDSDDPKEQKRAVALLEDLHANPPAGPAPQDSTRMVSAGVLAKEFLFGRGVETDVERGVDLLEQADATEAAEPDVVFLLGRTFESGWGGREPDAAKSYRYFLRAAQKDHSAAQWKVGMALLNGSGVEKNEQEAYRWVRKSGEAGYTEGELSTAVMLAIGQGVAENDAEARTWYERAVRKNSAHALRGLGFMLLTGEGGSRDGARGFAYAKLAADAGEETAVKLLPKFEPQVSAIERATADQIAAQWLKEHGAPTPD